MSGHKKSTGSRWVTWGLGIAASSLLLALVFAPGLASASASTQPRHWVYHVGDSFLAAVNSSFAPDKAQASNGDILEIAGNGTFNGAAKTVSGGGWFTHMHSNGTIVASGTWTAVNVVSFRSFGNGHPQGLPINFFGGILVIGISVTPTGSNAVISATLTVNCELGHPPSGIVEGVMVDVPGIITFDTSVGGATVFVLTTH